MSEFAERLDRAQGRLRAESRADCEMLDAKGAGDLLNLPPSWVLAEARAGRIPHVKFGRYVRFEPDELRAWWREKRQGPRSG